MDNLWMIYESDWLLSHASEKYEVNWDDYSQYNQYIKYRKTNIFQTTNQAYLVRAIQIIKYNSTNTNYKTVI